MNVNMVVYYGLAFILPMIAREQGATPMQAFGVAVALIAGFNLGRREGRK